MKTRVLEKKEKKAPAEDQTPVITSEIAAPYERANATFVSLARNEDLYSLVGSIVEVEDRFNKGLDTTGFSSMISSFDEEFKKVTSNLVSGNTYYELIPTEHWSFPDWIDQDRAALVREEMREKKIIYGDSVSYRHMCRFESGFFWRQKIMDNYQYYWRVEPDIKLYCDIDYDLFKFMEEKKLKYGFTLSLYEYIETIPTLGKLPKSSLKRTLVSLLRIISRSLLLMTVVRLTTHVTSGVTSKSPTSIFGDLMPTASILTTLIRLVDFSMRDGVMLLSTLLLLLSSLTSLRFTTLTMLDTTTFPSVTVPPMRMLDSKKKCRCKPKDNFTWK